MKSMRHLAVVVLVLCSQVAFAQSPFKKRNHNGIGIGLGSVSGLSGYYRLTDFDFVQGLLAFDSGDFYTSGDYCMTYPGAVEGLYELVPYYCLGAAIQYYEHAWQKQIPGSYHDRSGKLFLGARVPLGVQYFIPHTPLQLALEVGPSLWVVPTMHAFVQFLFSVRFLF